ncbi:DUF885 domain-containing protein [Actinobacteria bacterium YIM 96077]|uniref:DUF885 domain-containing protein n=1 Tax=Phytoactinopolyspora halophila TaxID=1981511 RepID=A0A329QHM2_9ACTN|nr:DUF885 domain-containing protein [Phytoactinopolyspora halophila]AYY14406.1 DUF885 domain-containing protein [Actinobacteria bacterium YIM 96077]RAW11873.1 DUF885 domain-containing protein [Phytoactinopolyspora halophila]
MSETPTETSPTTVDDVADAYVDELVQLDPFQATIAGVAGHHAESTDLSPDGFAERNALVKRTLRALDSAHARDERERVAAEAMRERLTQEVRVHDAGLDRALRNVASPAHEVREVFDLMPTETDEDWAAIARRLRAVPGSLDGYRATIEADIAAGLPPARRQVRAVIEQANQAAEGFFQQLARSAPDYLRAELDRLAATASSAYADFARHLADDVTPRARTEDAVGRDLYQIASQYFLGAEIDLDETYAWGLDELYRIESEMAGIAQQIVPGGSVDDAVAALDADTSRTIANPEAFRAWMQDLSDRTIAALNGTHFEIPEPIQRLECRIAPTQDGVVYYTGPSEDFARPGRMWWSVPEGVDTFSTWRETTTVFHEGVPGHHLQIAQMAYRSDILNRWQRLFAGVSGHAEGWALYAERLMAELGYLDDPGDRLGMLDGQAMRAVRVVVDIGAHLGFEIPAEVVRNDGLDAGPWTGDAVYEFLSRHTRQAPEINRFETTRYLGWPGQAPSYKVGERIFLEARENARQRKGEAFSLPDFHRAVLDLGALGLDPLQDALASL